MDKVLHLEILENVSDGYLSFEDAAGGMKKEALILAAKKKEK
jgi:hypothetical protein